MHWNSRISGLLLGSMHFIRGSVSYDFSLSCSGPSQSFGAYYAMETSATTFLYFSLLPKELRLRIWFLALPVRVIEQVWNNKKMRCEFVTEVPSILQSCHEPRAAFMRRADSDADTLVYRQCNDVRPFYFCKLDTIYVRRQR